MSSTLRLPPALLDLTLLRASPRNLASSRPFQIGHREVWKRWAHAAALLAQPPPFQDFSDHAVMQSDRSMYANKRKRYRKDKDEELLPVSSESEHRELSELEERVLDLKETVNSEESLVESVTYSEDELLHIYVDLLTPSSATPELKQERISVDTQAMQDEDDKLVQGIAQRLFESPDSVATSSTSTESHAPYRAIITRLQEITSALDKFGMSAPAPEEQVDINAAMFPDISTGILTVREWSSMTRACVRAHDGAAAETVLQLMKRSGVLELEESVNEVLSLYASAGDVAGAEHILRKFVSSRPSEFQRDLHVKAHVKSLTPDTFPNAILTLLHDYEAAGTPVPQKSYTRAITALLSTRSTPSQAHAQAWDLFAHMRYAAHPEPDTALYTLMLRACSHPAAPVEPERALDLFTEMTVDRGLVPTPGAYAGAAYAFARSGDPKYVHEAFRLAKEMLDAHRDARGRSTFKPDRRLFSALLEGAKRIGDLTRARWILAEMVRQSATAGSGDHEVLINDAVMQHVFHAYATFRPPFRRSATVLVDEQASSGEQRRAEPNTGPEEVLRVEDSSQAQVNSDPVSSLDANQDVREDFAAAGLPTASTDIRFSHIPPQSHAEVAREAKLLFTRIVEDSRVNMDSTDADKGAASKTFRPFCHVRLTSRLLNAYLSVHYAHSSFDTWSSTYRALFDDLGVSRNARTYVEALERCAGSSKRERSMALRLAEEIWGGWQSVEQSWRDAASGANEDHAVKSTDARLVERANAAMIRILALTGNVRRALDHVRAFSERYPPVRLLQIPPKHPLRSTRTVLIGARPLVRLTSTVDIPDDGVPPLLTFTELEVLHHRLLAVGDRVGLDYLKWLCKAYEGSLRRRRDATMRAVPQGATSDERLGDDDYASSR